MFDHLYQERSKTALKAYLIVICATILIVTPIKECISYLHYSSHFDNIVSTLEEGSVDEIPLETMLSLFQRSPYRGQWQKSVKLSHFLSSNSGLIEMRTVFTSSGEKDNYLIKIQVYNGSYLDNGQYIISIDSNSLLAKQRLKPGQIFYQTDTPFIAFFQNSSDSTHLLHESNPQSLFMSKLKIKIGIIQGQDEEDSDEGIYLQLGISCDNKINIQTKYLTKYPENYHDMFLAFLLILQCCIQISGVYYFYNEVYRRRQCGTRYSTFSFLMITASDGVEIIFLYSLCFSNQTKFTIYSIPAFLFSIQIFCMELNLLKLIDHQYKNNYFIFILKVYGTVFLFYIMTYIFNLDGWLFTVYSCSILFPQIIQNYIVGHKMKADLNKFFMFALPRYGLTIYLRSFKYNVFHLRPNYLFTLVNLTLILVQIFILLAQKTYGVRAILPKFMHPSEFKYFMNEPYTEDIDCSICLISLKLQPHLNDEELQPQLLHSKQKEDIFNNVVLTPCNHRFHIKCLVKWMQTKLQCPNCRTLLPPIEQYE